MGPIKNLVGQKYGMLTVVKYVGAKKPGVSRYLCVCECGKTREVEGSGLKCGRYYSCGCTRRYKTHHMSNTRLYHIWENIKKRCTRNNDRHYQYYGGRGITYCKEWEKFEPFMNWALANGYSDDLEIDRIDNDGNYCPENCRWVTSYENRMNRRITRKLTVNGIEKPLIEWCKDYNICVETVCGRLRNGWDPYEAVSVLPNRSNRRRKRNETKIA